jgi:acyl CoA:acetate/3-ketoacid CoA transferase beta subunit
VTSDELSAFAQRYAKAWCSLVLTELHPGVTEEDIRAKTGAPFDLALKD